MSETVEPIPVTGPRPRAPDFLLVALLAVLTASTALFSVFFLPWRIGSVVAPWFLLVGIAVVFWSVKACFRLTGSLWLAALPVAIWLVVCGWLSQAVVLGYATMLPDWRGQILLVVGALSGAAALGLAWGTKTLERTRGQATVRSEMSMVDRVSND